MNSREKGKRVEREAAKFLRELGFTSARRGVQYKGGHGSPDVICDELPNVWIEVKGNEAIDLGTKPLEAAWKQAWDDAGENQTPVVLWRRNRSCWRLTYTVYAPSFCRATITEPSDIRATLRAIQLRSGVSA